MPYHISEGGGGAEVQAWLLATELARRGYNVTYAAESLTGKAGSREIRERVEIHWLRHFRHFKWLGIGKIYASLCKIAPDLIVQRMSSFSTGVAAFYTRNHGKRFAWICTGDSVPVRWGFTRRQWRDIVESEWKGLKKVILLGNALLYDLLFQYGVKRATWLLTQNEVQRRLVLQNWQRNSLHIHSGHELPRSNQTALAHWESRTILWVGNLGANKRPELFIDLARHLQEDRVECVLVGHHENSEYLSRLFRDVPKNLKWLGRLPFEQALELFDKASVLVNTSVMEGFPNTFIQAWLRGVPTFSLGVDPDGTIANNRLGYVGHSISDLAKELRRLFSDMNGYIAQSEHVRQCASRDYNIARVTAEFVANLGMADGAEPAFSQNGGSPLLSRV